MVERLHPEDSRNWAHGRYLVSSVYLHTFLIALFFMTLGLLFSSREMKVARDNYSDFFYQLRSELINSTDVTFDEISEAIDESHKLHDIHQRNHIRYNFGTTFSNHCKVWPFGSEINFPSLLRRMTFSAATQSCIRAAVLISITVRLFAVYCRCSDIYLQTDTCTTCLLSIAAVVSDLATSVFGMFVTALQIENDEKSMPFLMHYSFLIFGISFFVSSSVYSFLETFDRTRKHSRILERVVCLLLFGSCFPFVNQNYSSFLLSKPCMIYVPMKVALCEYACIVAIIIFYMTQYFDLKGLQIVLSTERVETMCCMNYITVPDYYPAMLRDFQNSQNPADTNDFKPKNAFERHIMDIKIGSPAIPHRSIIFVW